MFKHEFPQWLQWLIMTLKNSTLVEAERQCPIDVDRRNTSRLLATAGLLPGLHGEQRTRKYLAPQGSEGVVSTVVDFKESFFANTVHSVTILGYHTTGVGQLKVRRVSSEPSHPWKFRCSDRYVLNSSTDNTNGGWWEGYSVDGINLYVEQFGARVDGVTDDYTSFANAVSYVASFGVERAGMVLNVGKGTSYISQTLILSTSLTLKGMNTGQRDNGHVISRLVFAANINGIVIPSGNYVTISGLYLRPAQDYNPKHDKWGPYNGIVVRCQAVIEKTIVGGFPQDGVNINANANAPPADPAYGNANVWKVDTCWFFGNGRHGLYVSGSDVNAGICIASQASGNHGYGFYESSYFGCSYYGLEADDNHAGGYYGYSGTWIQPYAEGNQPGNYWGEGAVVIQGLLANGTQVGSQTPRIAFFQGGMDLHGSYRCGNGAKLAAQLGMWTSGPTWLGFQDRDFFPNWLMFRPGGAGDAIQAYGTSSGHEYYTLTGPNTQQAFGRSATVPLAFHPSRLFIGQSIIDARQITYGTAPPSSRAWGKGDINFNINPTPAGAIGWRCTSAGTPGTWEPLIAASGTAYTIATLPTPNAALIGARAFVTDGKSSPAFLEAVGTTGTTIAPVFCNGRAWVYG